MLSSKVDQSTSSKTRQIVGSCRLSGMVVTKDDEALMSGIIDGEIDGAEYRKKLVEFYKNSNSRKGKF